jgi:hypothetical protein
MFVNILLLVSGNDKLSDSSIKEEFYTKTEGSGHGLKELGKGFFTVNLF